jgi:hypothetical protein
MANGLLKVQGRIPIDQFWANGGAHVDTTKACGEVAANSFGFQEHSPAEFRITHAPDKVRACGRVGRDSVPIPLHALVDLSELHFIPRQRRRRTNGAQSVLRLEPVSTGNILRRPLLSRSKTVLGKQADDAIDALESSSEDRAPW